MHFYVRCIILLSKQTEMDSFKTILQDLFIVAYGDFQGPDFIKSFNNISSAFSNKKIIKEYDKNRLQNISNEFSHLSNESWNFNLEKCTVVLNYIISIFVSAKNIAKNEKNMIGSGNIFCNENFCKNLISLCCHFIIWTKVMISSTSVNFSMESLSQYKEELKLYCAQETSEAPDIDFFIIKSVEFCQKKLNFVKILNPKNSKSKNQTRSIKKTLVSSFTHDVENWKNKNPPETFSESENESQSSSESELEMEWAAEENCGIDFYNEMNMEIDGPEEIEFEHNTKDTVTEDSDEYKKHNISEKPNHNKKSVTKSLKNKAPKQRGKYLRPCIDIDALYQRPGEMPRNSNKILVNCNTLRARKFQKEKIYINSSSYFDTIFQILARCYFLISKFKEFLDSSMQEENKNLFTYMLQQYVTELKPHNLYQCRSELIQDIVKSLSTTEDNVDFEYKIYWKLPIGEFFKKAVFPCISIISSCGTCKKPFYQHTNTVKMSLSEFVKTECFENLLKSKLEINKCYYCNALTTNHYKVTSILCLDVEVCERGTLECHYDIGQLNINLKIQSQKFRLIGVIAFEKPIADHNERHYIAYFKNIQPNNWLKFDDTDLTKKPTEIKPESKNIALLLYAEM